MTAVRILGEDLVRVRGSRYDSWTRTRKNKAVVRMLYWGDTVELIDPEEADDPKIGKVRIRSYVPFSGKREIGEISKKSAGGKGTAKRYHPIRWREGDNANLLEVTFVDVQQGDATLIQTPDRKLVLIDGGEAKFIARLLASMFPGSTAEKPLVIDALLITHGDADHFAGLKELAKAHTYREPRKNIHAKVARYFHNGLVKAGGKVKENNKKRNRREKEKLGDIIEKGDHVYITSLFEDPRDARDPNKPFRDWHAAMAYLFDGYGIPDELQSHDEDLPRIERIAFGQSEKLTALTQSGVSFDVLGPIVENVEGIPAIPFLEGENGGLSAGHTINGHSVVLKMRYGNVNFMLGGDLNTHAEKRLLKHIAHHGGPSLRSEIFKVPHHGSHEFDRRFLRQINPVVSIVSSGDENRMKEYVHPRANLMAALGRYSRDPIPLVFSTELAAFFAYRGPVQPEKHKRTTAGLADLPKSKQRGKFHAFQRLVFGAVRIRTDGKRVLCAVESANDGIKEAYAFTVSEAGEIELEQTNIL